MLVVLAKISHTGFHHQQALYATNNTKGTHHAPTQNPPGVAGAGRDRRSHPTAQHHVAIRRPYPPFFYLAQPQYLSVMLVLLPSALWFGITACMVASSFKRWL